MIEWTSEECKIENKWRQKKLYHKRVISQTTMRDSTEFQSNLWKLGREEIVTIPVEGVES